MEKPKIFEPEKWWLNSDNEILVGPTGSAKIARLYALSKTIDGTEHGECIIKAIKNTYGANINPEKIQELIEKTTKASKYQQGNLSSQPTELINIIRELQEALTNIKFK